ncbi:hypothetical protein GRF59_20185 [Paenibacillus sp. HJL G12]|uniref:Uncharacterized protein n=1 Tax=Paenibacillus dendrobii TaxID=2691084 RepID=A0A7X3ILS8_9BACL|nr:hypothetical protein [Paenibacillus dendrobii]MWV45940.1 hypothetical protein [Paenibacillus dendrobii]
MTIIHAQTLRNFLMKSVEMDGRKRRGMARDLASGQVSFTNKELHPV